MRLVFVNRFFHPDHSATSQILSDLAFGLASRGHEVHVVTSRLRYDRPASVLPAHETVRGVTVHRVWTSRFGRESLPGRAMDYLTFYLASLWRILRLARRGTVVVAKTDPPMISVVAALAAGLRDARLAHWTQDLFPEVAVAVGFRALPAGFARPLAAVRDWSLRRADRVVAIGEQMRARLLDRGVPEAKLAVIHNWADGAAIAWPDAPAGAQANPLRREWGLEGRFVVGYSGNLGRVHEFDAVLDAAGALAAREDIAFLFIGGGHQLEALKAEARRRGLANMQFRPYQPRERLAQSLAACDAHLVTLRPGLEGLVLPSKLYGVLAAARPVLFVGTAEGEIAALLRTAQCGEAFDADDFVSLAECIGRIASDRPLARRMGESSRRLFDERFAMPIAIGQWERLLAQIG
jgi:glycosyltransferase involved in cell wall biosynthesis